MKANLRIDLSTRYDRAVMRAIVGILDQEDNVNPARPSAAPTPPRVAATLDHACERATGGSAATPDPAGPGPSADPSLSGIVGSGGPSSPAAAPDPTPRLVAGAGGSAAADEAGGEVRRRWHDLVPAPGIDAQRQALQKAEAAAAAVGG